eukprot:4735883-Lingulodinium_polyedra.AAC.1
MTPGTLILGLSPSLLVGSNRTLMGEITRAAGPPGRGNYKGSGAAATTRQIARGRPLAPVPQQPGMLL